MRIKQYRKDKGLTQAQLGEKLGVAQSTVATWEMGEIAPRTKTLIKIAEVLQCTVDELLQKEPGEEGKQ